MHLDIRIQLEKVLRFILHRDLLRILRIEQRLAVNNESGFVHRKDLAIPCAVLRPHILIAVTHFVLVLIMMKDPNHQLRQHKQCGYTDERSDDIINYIAATRFLDPPSRRENHNNHADTYAYLTQPGFQLALAIDVISKSKNGLFHS